MNFGVILVGAEESNLRVGILNNHEKIVNVNNKKVVPTLSPSYFVRLQSSALRLILRYIL